VAGLSLIPNPAEPGSGFCFSLESDPNGKPKPDTKSVHTTYPRFNFTRGVIQVSEVVAGTNPGIVDNDIFH
jgi:hypothetical protein